MSIIELRKVTKEFRLGTRTSIVDSFKQAAARLRQLPPPERRRFLALDNLSFAIEPGEVVGIIGQNGAGKSTVLKLISRIITPTDGHLTVVGRIAPLIEVGAGLHPELTGRENVFLNATILGIPRRQIAHKLDDIIAFAELETFADTPVKRYSSGMRVRLGFAIATSVDADILVVDEVLAVGDLAFQRKCFDRMEELIRSEGRTVVLVSHNIRQVERLCSRVILLQGGRLFRDGKPTEVCNIFYDQSNQKILASQVKSANDAASPVETTGEIDDVTIELIQDSQAQQPANRFDMHRPLAVRVTFRASSAIHDAEVILGFHTTDFVYVASSSSRAFCKLHIPKGDHSLLFSVTDLPLTPGVYFLRLVFSDTGRRTVWHAENLAPFQVHASEHETSHLPKLGLVDWPVSWELSDSLLEHSVTFDSDPKHSEELTSSA